MWVYTTCVYSYRLALCAVDEYRAVSWTDAERLFDDTYGWLMLLVLCWCATGGDRELR